MGVAAVFAIGLSGACGKQEAGGADGGGATGGPQSGEPAAPETEAPKGEEPPPPPPVPNPAEGWSSDKRVRVVVRDAAPRADGAIQVELDVFDDAGNPVAALDPAAIALALDGRYVPGKYEVQGFREAGRTVGLSVIVPAMRSYTAPVDPEEAPQQIPLDDVKKGLGAALGNLREGDRVTLWALDDDGLRRVTTLGPPSAAAASLADLQGAAAPSTVAPAFYQSVRKVVDAMAESAADLPARRVLVLVGDGVDRGGGNARAVERTTTDIVERAVTPETDVEIWALGFTLGEEEPLVVLEALAQRTEGRYRRVTADGRAELAKRVEALVAEIDRTFVVTVVPDRPLPKKLGAFEIALKLPDGSVGRAIGGGR